MPKKMYTDDVKQYLNEHSDESAYLLLVDTIPGIDKRFNRVCRTLKNILTDVNKHFPDACYYTASGGLHIVLGDTHTSTRNGEEPNLELSAIGASNGLVIGDGDW